MPAIQVGQKCVKTRGRKAGKTVEVVKIVDGSFVQVKDAKGKVNRCNVLHLEPLP
ncbi:50S ribosomal protein L14e [Candidatus Micrarchaeota archaeon]|nr:50S ribosomal protein L14e [Candidatus Micrarchaeota archaeon]